MENEIWKLEIEEIKSAYFQHYGYIKYSKKCIDFSKLCCRIYVITKITGR